MFGTKCTVVGDGDVGKTSMLQAYVKNDFPKIYVPTLFETKVVDVVVRGETHGLALFDTAGQEDYDRLRTLVYACDADVLLVCFSVVNPTSFENVWNKWVPEIQDHCKGKPFLLIGTQMDLRTDEGKLTELAAKNQSPISREEGEALAMKLKAARYMECSVLTQEGLDRIFHDAVEVVLDTPPPPAKNRKCSII